VGKERCRREERKQKARGEREYLCLGRRLSSRPRLLIERAEKRHFKVAGELQEVTLHIHECMLYSLCVL
jgi:hypothetical protein